MVDCFFKAMPSVEGRLPCRLSFLQDGKASGRTALETSSECSLRLHIPRRLGAIGVECEIKDESLGATLAKLSLSWQGLEGDEDAYLADLPENMLEAGLYFLDIRVDFALGSYKVGRDNDGYFVGSEREDSEMPQMSLSRFEYPIPTEILGGVIYHVFVDRFNRGGRSEKKQGARIIEGKWDKIPEIPEYPGAPLKNNTYYGGTLDGVREKLGYFKELGVKLIYLSPIFESPSNHRYDTADYTRVDRILGGEEALSDLISDADGLGIKIILDGVFNHTGADSLYFNKFKSYGEGGAYNSKNSPYYDWFEFKKYPFEYTCWWDIDILPRIDPDKPSCGNYFVGEDGIIEKYRKMGIYGFRLDVVDELSDEFVSKIKAKLAEYGNSYLLGEVWEDASNKIAYGKRKRYYLGGELDGVMNYPLRRGLIDFLVGKGTFQLKYALKIVYPNTPKRISDTEMNLLGSHDTQRILTELSGEDSLGYSNAQLCEKRMSRENRETAKRRLLMAYTALATLPGLPSIYYADEVGLEGYSDPFNRMPYPYGEEDGQILSHYKKIGRIRENNAVYRDGDFKLLILNDELLAFSRQKGGSLYLTVLNNSDKELHILSSDSLKPLLNEESSGVIPPFSSEIFKTKSNTEIKAKQRTL